LRNSPTLSSIIAFLVGFGLAIFLLTPPLAAGEQEADVMLEAVNEVRGTHHLRAVEPRPELARVAEAHARDMLSRGYLSHVNPEGKNPLERVQEAGVAGFRLLAENIGATTVTPNPHVAVVRDWLASPRHRENLLHPAFNATGIGVAVGDGQTIYVQLFAAY
jgi:uncharacterized protein YkwD